MSDLSRIGEQLISAGAPVIGGLLQTAATAAGGPVAGALAGAVIGALKEALGLPETATPGEVADKIEATPTAPAIVAGVEERMFALWQAEAATMASLGKVEGPWGFFKDGWRPGLCWSLILMWLWSLILVPMIGGFGVRIAATPMDSLVAFSTLVLTILGGGHTLKAIWGKGAR